MAARETLAHLDSQLFAAISSLRSGKDSDLHLCPPEVVNYTDGCQLHYNGFGSHGSEFTSLSINDYVGELERCAFEGSMEDIRKTHKVCAKSKDRQVFAERWRIYDCFVLEASLGSGKSQKHYVLFAGNWYEIDRAFKDRVESFFEAIDRVDLIGKTGARNEEDLISRLEADRGDLLRLDGQRVNPDGLKNANLEPCDFLSKDKEFIHLKDGHSSSPISHLWAQGVVGAEAFVSDAQYRAKLRSKVRELRNGFESLLPKGNQKVIREDYKVVYGIMRKPYKDGTLGLPFFSKVSLSGRRRTPRTDWHAGFNRAD